MSKEKKHIFIKVSNTGVYYNPEEYIPWSSTNFPSKEFFNFNNQNEIFWQVELISFNKNNKELGLDVVDYNCSSSKEIFSSQKPKYPINKLRFRALIWAELEKDMNWYNRIEFDKIANSMSLHSNVESIGKRSHKGSSNKLGSESQQVQPRRINFTIRHSLMKTQFKMGFIELEKKIRGVPEKVTIIIENSHIIPEFDFVKPFFAKAIGKKKIEITGTVIIHPDKKTGNIRGKSTDLDLIDDGLISSVKRLKLKQSILKPKVVAVDKSLFTPDEYFKFQEDEIIGNTIRQSDKDILSELLSIEEIRNKKQLIYLSGKLQSPKTRLRFTLTKDFGFLFHVEGEQMDHFIWELLHSHATYIWSIDRGGVSLDQKFQILEKEINFIRDNGRMAYLRNNSISEFNFSKVNHESSDSSLKDGFLKWKQKVNEKLV